MTPVIEFRDFTFKYKAQQEPTLRGINLTVNKGEKVLVCGPSGCGKSTLAHCINGLIPASYDGDAQGELLIDGKSFRDYDIFSLSKHVGTVLQDSDGQFVGLTVGEDIAFALENDRVGLEEMRKRVQDIADRTGVGNFLKHAPHEVSGGQKQRVSLAGVMVDDVDILLFDEPLANLDPATGKTAIDLIDRIQKDTGATIVIIEHRLEDVLYRDVDRVILMSDGQIVSDTTPAKLLCSQNLQEQGIREPLYVTALKYAGVEITEKMQPQRIDRLVLDEAQKESVRRWYESVPLRERVEDRPVLLEVDGVEFAYPNGRKAVDDVSFKVRKGEMMSIVGRNGAGKSTISKIICGFEKQQKGTIVLNGTDLATMSIKERADHIGYVMQNPNQMISKSMIRDEVGLGLVLKKRMTEQEVREKVDSTLRTCGLHPFRSWPISALSYGQKKRVTIASILALDPEIVILDEPTAGQDYRHYTDIMEFLRQLNEAGVTIIMITHDMHLMIEYCERAVVFSDGHMVADKKTEQVLTDAEVVEKASLKETSLSQLAAMCGIEDGCGFIRRFIDFERKNRSAS